MRCGRDTRYWTECAQTHTHTDRQTDRQTTDRPTKVKTVYPPDYAKPATIGHNRPNVIEMLDLGSCIYFTQL